MAPHNPAQGTPLSGTKGEASPEAPNRKNSRLGPGLWHRLAVLARSAPLFRRRVPIRFAPLRDCLCDESGLVRVTGPAPRLQVLAASPLPTGWATVRLDTADVSSPCVPILWAEEDGQRTLHALGFLDPAPASGTLDQVIRLPDRVQSLCLDLTGLRGSVRLSGATIRELGVFDLALRPLIRRPSVMASGLRVLRAGGGLPALKTLLSRALIGSPDLNYECWVRLYDHRTAADRAAIGDAVERLPWRPLLSVLMPVHDPDPADLRAALNSVLAQLYPDWELCIADDASTDPAVIDLLADYARRDPRVRVERRTANGNISAASNTALAMVRGPFVALMDHDDLLPEHALYCVAAELNAHPDADLLYSDEDKVDETGRRYGPYFKPGWDPELLLSQNFISHLGVYRTDLLRRIGGFRLGYEGSQDHDLALRVSAASSPARIRHIPRILYHWRVHACSGSFSTQAPQQAMNAARRAVNDYLAATGQVGQAELGHPQLRVRRAPPSPLPSVSLVMTARGPSQVLRRQAEELLRATHYPGTLDVLVLPGDAASAAENDTENDAGDGMGNDPRIRVLPCLASRSLAALRNDGAAAATGNVLGFIDPGLDPPDPDWLLALVTQAVRSDVGATGAKLLDPDRRVEHAGFGLGIYGLVGHPHRGLAEHAPGYLGRALLPQSLSAVSGACLVTLRERFESVGGFDATNLPETFHDVDFCLRLGERGYRVVWTPQVVLIRRAGRSQTPPALREGTGEEAWMRRHWAATLSDDPAGNPNLSLESEQFQLAFPPRTVPAWVQDRMASDAD